MNSDEMPSPEEQKLMLATIPGDTATALRLVSAFAAGDVPTANAQIAEIAGLSDLGLLLRHGLDFTLHLGKQALDLVRIHLVPLGAASCHLFSPPISKV
jgi:hypothetical protein